MVMIVRERGEQGRVHLLVDGRQNQDDLVPAIGEPAQSTLEIAQIKRVSQKDDDLHAEKAPKGKLSALVYDADLGRGQQEMAVPGRA